MQGLHITADWSNCGCEAGLLIDAQRLQKVCEAAVARCGLRQVNALFHSFAPGAGVTGVVLLAESHVAVHTWPELSSVTLDVYVCNYGADNSSKARALATELALAFKPARPLTREWSRG